MALPHPPSSPAAPTSPAQLRLWYERPAGTWVEALPVGSGRLGAMVFGGVAIERLALNEDTLWAGGPYDPNSPRALAALPELRRLIFAGKYAEAQALAADDAMAVPLVQMPYQTAGDAVLSFEGLGARDGADEPYRRELDLETAIARTTFLRGGVRFVRDVFASPVDQVIVVRLYADQPGRIAFDLTLRPPSPEASAVREGTDSLVLEGNNRGESGVTGALRFAVHARVVASGGTTRTARAGGEDRVCVHDADAAVVLLSAATSYRSFRDVSGDARASAARTLALAARKGEARLLADHLAEHARLFGRVAIDLGASTAAERPTDERVRLSAERDDPQLAALYFQYGRYLLISCSRPGTQPANLQGLWNESLTPPWGCKYTINVNTEMNYWPAEPANLAECALPLVSLVEDLTETGADTARAQYGARGWVCHHNTDLWRAAAPVDGPQWGLWPTGGAWLCMSLWDHYDYGRDPRYLARIYPLLRGAALFFLDTLVPDPSGRGLVTCPSLSPENVHPGGASICAGPAMDRQILRDLFSHCIEASEALGVDAALRDEIRTARARLAPDRVGSGGQLQEWLDDWDARAPEPHHRHVSHLYACYPSDQITLDETPELAAAARRSLELRGDDATGWGLAWRLNLWARLRDPERAHAVLRRLLGPERTYPNLFDAHPPFQIDGNFGGVAGICEMLVQGHRGEIRLLPALPAAWPEGWVRGLRTRRGLGVDLAWKEGRIERATLRGPAGLSTPVRHRDEVLTVTFPPSGEVTIARGADGRLTAR